MRSFHSLLIRAQAARYRFKTRLYRKVLCTLVGPTRGLGM
jgi:hypothetical protein